MAVVELFGLGQSESALYVMFSLKGLLMAVFLTHRTVQDSLDGSGMCWVAVSGRYLDMEEG